MSDIPVSSNGVSKLLDEFESLLQRWGDLGGSYADVRAKRKEIEAEVERLTRPAIETAAPQAPIAKVIVRESRAGHYAPDDVSVTLYAPGLPPGEHDVYLDPSAPGLSEETTGKPAEPMLLSEAMELLRQTTFDSGAISAAEWEQRYAALRKLYEPLKGSSDNGNEVLK